DPLDEITVRELLAIFDEEVGRLPERYRLPLILCCLEGRTQEEAARQLGWTPGSVKGRLERARTRLHGRLVRRGLTLPAVLVSLEAVRATALPAGFITATVRAAAGHGAREIAAIAATTLRSTPVLRPKVVLALLLAVGAVAVGFAAVPRALPRTEETHSVLSPQSSVLGKARPDPHGDPLPDGAL